MSKILIVEDEAQIARFVELELIHEGNTVDKAEDGRTGLDKALASDYDLILLDVMLPGINGFEVLRRVRAKKDTPVILLTARDAVMDKVSGLDIKSDAVCMTVGAASAMNDVLHSLLDPEDEVIVIAPYFMEYNGYIANHGGKAVIVQTDDKFMPVISSIKEAITPRTKAVIINSPNNPSGVVYPSSLLSELNDMLKAQDHVIHVISDEPYIDLVYDGMTVPCALKYIDNLIVCFSWSKSLSLPGERIGYTLVSPKNEDYADLTAAIVLSNRTLGSVNAPAIWQRVIEKSLNAKVDVSNYENRRNLLYSNIIDAGFDAVKPNGALYIFMNTPEGLTDDKFSEICASKNLLLVKGSSFSRPGYCRLAFCVSESTIRNSRQAFFAIAEELGISHRASL